jgi:hypothetical protein
VVHELKAQILQTDEVKFELSFVPYTQWGNVDSAATLGEDAGRCVLVNNSD